MDLFSLLKLVLSLASSFAEYMRDRQLLKAGEAQAIKEGLESAIITIEKARNARRNAVRKFRESNGMPDDTDPNLRD